MNDILETTLPQCILIVFVSGKSNLKLYVLCEMVDPRFNRSGVPSITCLAHSLQCVIHDGVLAQKDVQDLLAVGRKIVGHYKHSNVAFHLLQRIQAQLELKVCPLFQDEPTSWNSSYYMLKRLVEQRKAISAANAEADASFNLTTVQWKLAEKVIKLLQPFEEATEDISSDSSSIALFIPIVNSLNKPLQVDEEDHGIMSMKQKCCYQCKTALQVVKLKTCTACPHCWTQDLKTGHFLARPA